MVKFCRQPKLANNSFGWSIVIWNMTASDSSTTASWMTLSATNKIHFRRLLPTYHLQLQDNFPSSAQSSPHDSSNTAVNGWWLHCVLWCFRTTNHDHENAVVRLPTQTMHYYFREIPQKYIYLHQVSWPPKNGLVRSGCNQPICSKYCSSNWNSSPNRGDNTNTLPKTHRHSP